MRARSSILLVLAAAAWLRVEAQTTPVAPRPVLRVVTNTQVFFECRNDELFRVDVEGLKRIYRVAMVGHDQAPKSLESLLQKNLGDATYAIDPAAFSIPGLMMLKPKRDAHGEPAAALEKPDGLFRTTLGTFEPANSTLIFFVRPDSSNVWNAASAIATNAGFRVGAQPLKPEHPLTFSVGKEAAP